MKISEILELGAEELNQRLAGLKKEQFDLRMARAAGKLTHPHRIRAIRQDVARISTVIRQRLTLEEAPPRASAQRKKESK